MTKPVPIGASNTPFVIRAHQDFAVEQERYRHDQAIYTMGENAMFALMWKVEDFYHNLVQHCSTCYNGEFARQADVYKQPTRNLCPDCFGTTFEGGIRAKVVRPALFTDTDDQEVVGEHGVTYPQTLSVESTSDFRFRNGDYVIRFDGSRWQLSAPQRVTVRTGFGHPTQVSDSIGYTQALATLEDKTSAAQLIPPTADTDIAAILAAPSRYPEPSPADVINGPLIPPAWTD